jgi:glycosyltransferase involved in cell wall biosynthesis
MKICIVAPFRIHPSVAGASRRVFEFSRALSKAGASVVVAHAGRSESIKNGPQLVGFPSLENFRLTKPFIWSRAIDTYLSSANIALTGLLLRIFQRMEFDILQIEGPWAILPASLVQSMTQVPVIYDAHNVEALSVRYSSAIPWLWPYAAFMERMAVQLSNMIFCVSEPDRAFLTKLYQISSAKVTVVPNGVSPLGRAASDREIRIKLGMDPAALIVLFHGALSWKPNADAAEVILDTIAPETKKINGDTLFLIAGPDPPRRLSSRARRVRNVKVLGLVRNIEDYISCANVCIAPLKARSGTRIKLLEYFAAGKPVVATREAAEGLNVRNGIDALLFDNVNADFIRGIQLAAAPKLSHRLGSNAKKLATEYEWNVIASNAVSVYESVLSRRPSYGRSSPVLSKCVTK